MGPRPRHISLYFTLLAHILIDGRGHISFPNQPGSGNTRSIYFIKAANLNLSGQKKMRRKILAESLPYYQNGYKRNRIETIQLGPPTRFDQRLKNLPLYKYNFLHFQGVR